MRISDCSSDVCSSDLNERLLVAGSWRGLGAGRAWTKDEAHRLARIRLDIPNNADIDWKIDIRKSTARPPIALRSWLVRLAEETRSRSRRAFAHRGRPVGAIQGPPIIEARSEEHTSELQSLMRISYAVFCLK